MSFYAMDDESRKECPMCASRNVSFSEREHALVCRDCGTVIAGKPVKLDLPREDAIEVVHEVPSKFRMMERKIKAKAKKAKAKKVSKKKVKKAKKTVKKKIVKKVAKKAKPKHSFMRRLLRRR